MEQKKSFFLRASVALRNRVFKWVKYNNVHYFLDKERVMTKEFLSRFPSIDEGHYAVGNYFLHTKKELNTSSIVYSFGILKDVSFDKAVAQKWGVKVFMYDPTPQTVEFMEQFSEYENFVFVPKGVWTENTTLTFMFPQLGGSASAVVKGDIGKSFDAHCESLQTIMQEHNHTHIDVLKMDIEGAALPITEYMIEHKIFPEQLIVEYERPRNDMPQTIEFFDRVSRICETYKSKGYDIYALPREKYKYYSLEFLFVKR